MERGLKVQDPLVPAQACVLAMLLPEDRGRRWLKVPAVNSYGEPSNGVEFFVLEGSPPRGFVIAWRALQGGGYARAAALDSRGNRLEEFGSLVLDDE